MHARQVAALSLLSMVAGCLATESDGPADGVEGSGPRAPWTTPFMVRDCRLVWAAVPIELERAETIMPPGYEPQRIGNLAGVNEDEHAPVPTTTLNLAGMDCPYHSVAEGAATWAYAAIDIRPPTVDGAPSPSPHDLYDVLYATADKPLSELLVRAGLPTVHAEVEHEVTTSQGVASGVLRVTQGDDDVFRLEIASVGPVAIEGSAAFWHQQAEGVALTHLDGRPDTEAWAGKVLDCRIGAGSLLAQLAGGTDCTASAYGGFVGAEYAIDFTLTYLRGAAAKVAS